MRNIENAIKKVNDHKGLLTKSLVVRTAKQTLNQYNRGWIKPKTTECIEAIDALGILEFLEKPLLNRKLADDLTTQGIEWLNRFLFTKKGIPRKNKETQNASTHVYEVVKNFSHFTFGGFTDVGYSAYSNYIPCWVVHAKNGKKFTYIYGGPYSTQPFEWWY